MTQDPRKAQGKDLAWGRVSGVYACEAVYVGGLMVVHLYTVGGQAFVHVSLCSQTLRWNQRVLPALF